MTSSKDPRPLQIISIGEDCSDNFHLNKENLDEIISKIPSGMKVAVLSVVGAFRTGKSFILNFFLRYLRAENIDESDSWMFLEGDELVEGNNNNLGEDSTKSVSKSFAWRGGNERQTTGIWMWSEPFFRTTSRYHEKIAIMVMDTQGMFDNQTTMSLTAQIFGLSTLVSSFQIYNVEKRIGEDNLQHLALFSEYGRMALDPTNEAVEVSEHSEGKDTAATSATSASTPASTAVKNDTKPFQKLLFLIRDYQNFESEHEDFPNKDSETQAKLKVEIRQHMKNFMQSVITDKNNDLQVTRDQIKRCFQKVDCFMLPHPGNAVTKKNFNGAIRQIDDFFRQLINIFVRQLFENEIEPKCVNNRFITGPELKIFFEVYSALFQDGNSAFPKAVTMLEATAEASCRNALSLSIESYKTSMRGSSGSYMNPDKMRAIHDEAKENALSLFDSMATLGPPETIQKFRSELEKAIHEESDHCFQVNAMLNPMKDMEMYVIPFLVAVASWLLSKVLHATCDHNACLATVKAFKRVYLFIFFVIIALTYHKIKGIFAYIKEILPIIMNGALKEKMK